MSPMKFKHKICLLKTHVAASPPQHAHMRTDTRTHMHTHTKKIRLVKKYLLIRKD